MTLDNLLRIGKLKAHTATRIEVVRLLDATEQSRADASVVGLSAASRLDAGSRVRVLDAFRGLRNQVDYRGVPISDAVADECRAEAHDLVNHIRSWIAARQPHLL